MSTIINYLKKHKYMKWELTSSSEYEVRFSLLLGSDGWARKYLKIKKYSNKQ